MDDTNSGGIDLNLDPDMITTQGQAPQVAPALAPSKIIDITPGKPDNALPESPVLHIDSAPTPVSGIIDITPSGQPPAPITQESPVVETPPAIPVAQETPVVEPTPVAPVVAETPLAPTPSSEPILSATPPASVAPETSQPVVTPPVAPLSSATADSTTFKIDTTSPLYEDPDKVVLTK